jgi:dTDP-4-amino-4,6-dideoxygalactose transaminase
MSVDALAEKLEDAERSRRLPKVVIPVHLCGQPCDMAGIGALAERYGFKVVEDASHAIGATYDGGPVGNCAHSDITIFSFHPVKIVTTAEGGLATTRDAALAERMRLLRSHGLTRNPAQMEWEADGPWYYQQISLGYNYRMTELQAALGVSQMKRLDEFVARRRQLAALYDGLLETVSVATPYVLSNIQSAWHLYVVRVDAARRRAIFEAMRAADIGVNVHYIPVPSQPWYRRLGHDPARYPNAQAYYAETISIPLYYGMRDEDARPVVTALRNSL